MALRIYSHKPPADLGSSVAVDNGYSKNEQKLKTV
jgi:hypothetical protein